MHTIDSTINRTESDDFIIELPEGFVVAQFIHRGIPITGYYYPAFEDFCYVRSYGFISKDNGATQEQVSGYKKMDREKFMIKAKPRKLKHPVRIGGES